MAKQTVVTTSVDRWQRPPPVATSGYYTTAPSTSSRATGLNSTEHISQRQLTYPPHQSNKKRSHHNHRGDGIMSPPGITDGDLGGGGVGRGGSGGCASGGGAANNSGGGGGCSAGGSGGGTRGGGNPGGGELGSGGVVPHHDLENLESCSRNPLLCLICNNIYDDPRLLACYHSFCAKCLQGRIGETKLICPLCGYVYFLLFTPPLLLFAFAIYICTSVLHLSQNIYQMVGYVPLHNAILLPLQTGTLRSVNSCCRWQRAPPRPQRIENPLLTQLSLKG